MIAVDDAALTMVARAAEGSARDALSILDQAIAHAAGAVSAEEVRQMLGLADRALVIDLFAEVMGGDVAAALKRLKELYDVGADPAVVLEDLAAFTHLVTRLKLAPSAAEDDALTAEEKTRGAEFAGKISLRALARAWQMLLKGIEEARAATRPLAAADMVIVRLAHASDLPTPDEAVRALKDGGGTTRAAAPERAAPADGGRARMAATGGTAARARRRRLLARRSAETAPTARFESFAEIVAFAGQKREVKLKHDLETDVRLIRFEPGQIEIAVTDHAPAGLAGDLSRKLEEWTGQRWMIAVAREGGAADHRRDAPARPGPARRRRPRRPARGRRARALPWRRDRRCQGAERGWRGPVAGRYATQPR